MKTKLFLICFILIVTTVASYGQVEELEKFVDGSNDVLNRLQNDIHLNAKKWVGILKKYAMNLFIMLATINLMIRVMFMLIEGNVDAQKVVGFLAKYAFITGLFLYFLNNGVQLASEVVNSFIRMGTEASGASGSSLQIEQILVVGNKLMNQTINQSISIKEIPQAIISFIVAFATYLVLILILANYIVEIGAAWILVYAGYFVLAFGGMEWTREVAIAYIKAVIAAGLRLISVMFLIGLAISMITKQLSVNTDFIMTTLSCFGTGVLLLILINKIPDAIGSLVSSAWGHMSSFNMASGIAASMTALKVASGAVNNTVKGGSSFKSGVSDYFAGKSGSKEVVSDSQDKKEGGSDNKDNKSSSGLAYQAGKGTGFLLDKAFSKKSSSTNSSVEENAFGQSSLMSKMPAREEKEEKK